MSSRRPGFSSSASRWGTGHTQPPLSKVRSDSALGVSWAAGVTRNIRRSLTSQRRGRFPRRTSAEDAGVEPDTALLPGAIASPPMPSPADKRLLGHSRRGRRGSERKAAGVVPTNLGFAEDVARQEKEEAKKREASRRGRGRRPGIVSRAAPRVVVAEEAGDEAVEAGRRLARALASKSPRAMQLTGLARRDPRSSPPLPEDANWGAGAGADDDDSDGGAVDTLLGPPSPTPLTPTPYDTMLLAAQQKQAARVARTREPAQIELTVNGDIRRDGGTLQEFIIVAGDVVKAYSNTHRTAKVVGHAYPLNPRTMRHINDGVPFGKMHELSMLRKGARFRAGLYRLELICERVVRTVIIRSRGTVTTPRTWMVDLLREAAADRNAINTDVERQRVEMERIAIEEELELLRKLGVDTRDMMREKWPLLDIRVARQAKERERAWLRSQEKWGQMKQLAREVEMKMSQARLGKTLAGPPQDANTFDLEDTGIVFFVHGVRVETAPWVMTDSQLVMDMGKCLFAQTVDGRPVQARRHEEADWHPITAPGLIIEPFNTGKWHFRVEGTDTERTVLVRATAPVTVGDASS